MKFKSVVSTSTIDYPDELSTVLFVGSCNWDCEYCYNKNLPQKDDIDFENEILPRLISRRTFIKHVVISGGECTLYKDLELVIDTLLKHKFTVGIHTNGTNPNVLKKIIPKVSFIGMDIKGCIDEDFGKTNKTSNNISNAIPFYKNTGGKAIDLIVKSNVKSEFRTTLYPKYIDEFSIAHIGKILKEYGVKEWILQDYTNNFDTTLVNPYSKSEINKLVELANTFLPTKLKGE